MPVDPFSLSAGGGADYFAGDNSDMMGLWEIASGAGDNPFSLMGGGGGGRGRGYSRSGGYDMLGEAITQAQMDAEQQGLPANVHTLASHPAVRNAIRNHAATAVAMNQAKAQALKQAMAQQMPGGTDRGREQILPLDSGASPQIAANASQNITSQPQRAFRTERLVIDSVTPAAGGTGGNISSSFVVNNLLVGADIQFLALTGSIPASMFAPNAVGTRLKGTVAVPGIIVTISVTNIDSAAHRFLGAVLGPALD